LVALKGYLFIIGAIFSYIPLFLTNPATAVAVNAVGITISLYIWYVLAANRDRGIAALTSSGTISERDLSVLGIRKSARFFASIYSVSFVLMTLSMTFVFRRVMENIEIFENMSDVQLMVETLGTVYMIASGVFTITAIVSLVFLYKLLDVLLNDEVKLQSVIGKRRKLPMMQVRPVSIALLLFLIVLSYGLFSWFLRYRIAVTQQLFGKLEEQMKEVEEQKKREEDHHAKLEDEVNRKAADLGTIYERIFSESPEGEKRREALATFFKDLSEIDYDKAKTIIKEFLEKNLITEREYKRIDDLIS